MSVLWAKRGWMGKGTFAPHQLFTSGAQGAWYDPSDYSTLYQDAAGTTPVTAVEQPVRLMLDRSKGLVLGSELVTNGGFDTDSDWLTNPGWGITGGAAVCNNTSGVAQNIEQSISIVANRSYRVSFTISSYVSGNVRVRFAGGTNVDSDTFAANGSYSVVINSVSGNNLVALRAANATALSVDNVSVRELPGNHATAPNDASRPVLRSRYNLLTRSEEFDDAAWSKVDTTVTANAGVAPDGTTTADKLIENNNASAHGLFGEPITRLGAITWSVYLKEAERRYAGVIITDAASPTRNRYTVIVDLQTGTVTDTKNTGTPSNPSHTVTAVGNGWYRVSLTLINSGAEPISPVIVTISDSATPSYTATGAPTYTGDNTSGIYVWGAQLLTAADHAATGGAYQRIGSATDYDTGPPWRPYLAFDGSDDSMSTSSIDFNTVTSDGQPRRNLLVNPTQFDAAGWTKTRATVTANTAVAPDGTTTADTFTEDSTASSTHFLVGPSSGAPSYTTAATVTASIFVKIASGTRNVAIRVAGNNGSAVAIYNPSTGAFVTSTTTGTNWTFVSSSVTALADGWYRITCTGTHTETSGGLQLLCNLADDSNLTYTGDGTSGAYIWGAQLETGSTATAFQNIGTDKMTVFAGVTKLSDATQGMLLETSTNVVDGGVSFFVPSADTTPGYRFTTRGTATSNAIVSVGYAAPVTNTLTGISDISGDVVTLRVNGTQVATSASDQGTGNFGNYPLFIGRRAGSSLPFNGRLYGLTVLGRTATAPELTAMESWIAGKTGVSLS